MFTSIKKDETENLFHYIAVFEKIITSSFCDELIAEFKNSEEWNFARVGADASIHKNIRNADVISLSDSMGIQKNLKSREKIERTLFRACGDAIRQYQRFFPFCPVVEGMGF